MSELDIEEEIDEEIEEEIEDDTDIEISTIDSDDDSEHVIEVSEPIPNTIYIITGDNRKTSDILTLKEFARIVGVRATQIADNIRPKIFTDVDNITSVHDMVIKEIRDKKCPFKIRRKISPTHYEEWSINEMMLPNSVRIGESPTNS